MTAIRLGAVAIVGLILGGWAIPLGFVLDLGPIAVYVAAAIGGIIGCWALIMLGDRVIARFGHPRQPSGCVGADAPVTTGKTAVVGRLVDRHGARGLGLVGPIFPGVTVSVIAGLALKVPGRELGRWLTIGILVMYGAYVAGLQLLIWIV